jgi:hypothetical protein
MYATRRHSVVLDSAVGVWLSGVALGIASTLAARGHPGSHLDKIGAAVFLAGTVFFGWKACQWWVARYAFTNERVLLIEGILYRRVNGLPLRRVLDTTYHRTLAGRLFGYGDLEMNLSGQPGLRKLTALPHPDTTYHLVLSLIRDLTQSSPSDCQMSSVPSASSFGDLSPGMPPDLSRTVPRHIVGLKEERDERTLSHARG